MIDSRDRDTLPPGDYSSLTTDQKFELILMRLDTLTLATADLNATVQQHLSSHAHDAARPVERHKNGANGNGAHQ